MCLNGVRFIFRLIYFCIVFNGVCNSETCGTDQQDLDDDDVFITLSSINKFKIEINWNCSQEQQEIRLYNQEPPFEGNQPKYIFSNKEKHGFIKTNITYDINNLPIEWRKESTLTENLNNTTYCASLVKNNRTTKTSCLKIQPTWMKDNGDVIGDIPLTKLMIPGTHNSGCYGNYPELDLKDPVFKFIYTQDSDVYTQLLFGIRYLDIRVGYYNTTFTKDSFLVNHDLFHTNLVTDILKDIKRFLDKAKDEIIILDFHRFPVGFKTFDRHEQFLELIDKEIGHLAIPRNFQKPPTGPTLKEIWEQKGRIIICYGNSTVAQNSEYLWDPLLQKWGNKQNLPALKKYLQDIQSNHSSKNNNHLWAAMAELTATPTSVFFGLLSSSTSVAHMADIVNRNLSDWYRNEDCETNIIATDYFLGNDMVNIAINCNLKTGHVMSVKNCS